MFEFKKEKMLAPTIDEAAMEKKWILRGRNLQTTEKGDSVL